VAAFWQLVEAGLVDAGAVAVMIEGPSPGELRYEPTASATIIDGRPTFVCIDGQALDGQSGWLAVPGEWTCGVPALIRGFRSIGQPLDAWTPSLPKDSGIREAIAMTDEGRWRWTFRASSPFAGSVTTRVTVEPGSGRIVAATRTDDVGRTDYTIDYDAGFPPIAVP
jgi:hypothetical protein